MKKSPSKSLKEGFKTRFANINQKAEQKQFTILKTFLLKEWKQLRDEPLNPLIIQALDHYEKDLENKDSKILQLIDQSSEFSASKKEELKSRLPYYTPMHFMIIDSNTSRDKATLILKNSDWTDLDKNPQFPAFKWIIPHDDVYADHCKYLKDGYVTQSNINECSQYIEQNLENMDNLVSDLKKNPKSRKKVIPSDFMDDLFNFQKE